MTTRDRIQYRLACTVMLWLLKGMCLGFGAAVGWIILRRVCHALFAM